MKISLHRCIDALEKIEIKCEGEIIQIVSKFTLLGVTLDEYLTFDLHTISVCSKVNWKISVLKKSSFLFDLKFRIILFKLFIVSKYDYCSTLFIHFSDNFNRQRLENNFAKALKSYLNIKIQNLQLEEQFNVLKHYNLLPLNIRLFQNLVFFIFSLVQGNRPSTILKTINSFKKIRVTRTHFFEEPIYKTVLYKYSCVSIAIRLLNAFIFKSLHLDKKIFRSAFEASSLQLYNAHNKHWT